MKKLKEFICYVKVQSGKSYKDKVIKLMAFSKHGAKDELTDIMYRNCVKKYSIYNIEKM